MNKYKINSKTAMPANLIPLLALIICVGAVIIFIKPQAAVYNDEVTLLLDGWVDFEGIGTSYRTGGDEFIVIATTDQTAVIAALEKLESASAEYNQKGKPPIPLRLAYGCALYTEESESLEAAEKKADKRMYEKKKHMKSEG